MVQNRITIASLHHLLIKEHTKTTALIPWFICSLGALYYCYEYFLRITPSVMTNELMHAYHLTAAQVGSLSAFYYHAYVPMQIAVGLLMDRYGPRRLLTYACLCCALGTYLFASGYSLHVAELGRFLVGFGSAFAFVGALKLATIWLPPNRFALISGIILCLGMIGAMAGDIILRMLVDSIGWQITIFASAAVGVVLAIILWSCIRDVKPEPCLSHTEGMSFTHLLFGLFDTLKNPQIWINGLIGFLLYLSLSAFAELWGIPYLEQARGLSKLHAADANSLVFLGWAIGGPLWGWLSDHLERRRSLMLFSSVGAALIAIILLYIPSLSLTQMYFLLFFFGLLCSAQIIVFAVCREVTQIKIAATAIALTNMIVMIGGNLFQPVIGMLLDKCWTGTIIDGVRIYNAHDYQVALSVLPIGILVAIGLIFFLKETYARGIDENIVNHPRMH